MQSPVSISHPVSRIARRSSPPAPAGGRYRRGSWSPPGILGCHFKRAAGVFFTPWPDGLGVPLLCRSDGFPDKPDAAFDRLKRGLLRRAGLKVDLRVKQVAARSLESGQRVQSLDVARNAG